jgi:hypothetical protein
LGFPDPPLSSHSFVEISLSSDIDTKIDSFQALFLGWTLVVIFAKVSQCQPLTCFIVPLPQIFVVFLWYFPMAAIEENPLQPLPPPNTFEEDRALLLHTHRTWRRSQHAEIMRTAKSEEDQSGHTSPQKSQDFFQVDLREADFRHQDLRNANFQEAYLPGANFEGTDLRGANFQGANLRSVRFTDAQLAWANFSQADLIWADFQQTDLQGADFQKATLRGATFVRAQIRGGNFFSTDCSWADFREADLNESDFQQANLNGTTFLKANTASANFQGSYGQHEPSATDFPPPHDDQLFP